MGNVGTEVVRILAQSTRRSCGPASERPCCAAQCRGTQITNADRGVAGRAADHRRRCGLVARDDVVWSSRSSVGEAGVRIQDALEGGQPVVTANKALLANSPASWPQAAENARVDLYFEAASPAASRDPPLTHLSPLTRSTGWPASSTAPPTSSSSAMDEDGAATPRPGRGQRAWYAEADPTADVEGYDAAAKPRSWPRRVPHPVTAGDVYREGISRSPPPTSRTPRAGLHDQAAGHL